MLKLRSEYNNNEQQQLVIYIFNFLKDEISNDNCVRKAQTSTRTLALSLARSLTHTKFIITFFLFFNLISFSRYS